ncbi:hypothetical protein [Tautonia rosea]|uniref:hypothetical protein n=1 Tax=Tautonia rosea TaxID=2728037 RepID=UPI0014730672|nr:hypothetical protein [Tautonia rosea]
MATMKQTIANRLNALKSTGPRTLEGRARSARNALKHGLSRLGSTRPAALADLIAERIEHWREAYRPEGPAQLWMYERLCAESVRLDACERRILAVRAEIADRAFESWDDDRAAEVASLASRLATHPEVIQPKLLQSKHGVLWLLDRWDEVADSLQRLDGWTPETWNRAMDLLGVSALAREGSGPWDLDPDDNGAGPGLELAYRSIEALRARIDTALDARDARARDDAEEGLDSESPQLRLLERYASDARRQIDRCRNELRRLQATSHANRGKPDPATPSIPVNRPPRQPSSSSLPPNAPADQKPTSLNAAQSKSRPNLPSSPSRLVRSSPLLCPSSAPTPLANRQARRAQAARARRS